MSAADRFILCHCGTLAEPDRENGCPTCGEPHFYDVEPEPRDGGMPPEEWPVGRRDDE
jgi:hypothetical protein